MPDDLTKALDEFKAAASAHKASEHTEADWDAYYAAKRALIAAMNAYDVAESDRRMAKVDDRIEAGSLPPQMMGDGIQFPRSSNNDPYRFLPWDLFWAMA